MFNLKLVLTIDGRHHKHLMVIQLGSLEIEFDHGKRFFELSD